LRSHGAKFTARGRRTVCGLPPKGLPNVTAKGARNPA
jgi:hypothetical protein